MTFNYSDTIDEGDVIAVGDIHGRYDLFRQVLDWAEGSGAHLILLGDLIDRGPDDINVLSESRKLLEDPSVLGLEGFTVLRGNHEQMLLNAVEGYGWEDWVRNGGDWENFQKIKEHAGWIHNLPLYVTLGSTMFSHAGCVPGRNPDKSMVSNYLIEEFVWMREPFLTDGPQFEKWSETLKLIVFGHTPKSPLPYRVPSGICIDTGAFRTGILTTYNATQDTFNQFEIE